MTYSAAEGVKHAVIRSDTEVEAGSKVTLVSARVTGDFSTYPTAQGLFYFDNTGGGLYMFGTVPGENLVNHPLFENYVGRALTAADGHTGPLEIEANYRQYYTSYEVPSFTITLTFRWTHGPTQTVFH